MVAYFEVCGESANGTAWQIAVSCAPPAQSQEEPHSSARAHRPVRVKRQTLRVKSSVQGRQPDEPRIVPLLYVHHVHRITVSVGYGSIVTVPIYQVTLLYFPINHNENNPAAEGFADTLRSWGGQVPLHA